MDVTRNDKPLRLNANGLPAKDRTLALFLLLMCDWTLFEAVYGEPTSTKDFDPKPIFARYTNLNPDDFTDAINDVANAEEDLEAARIAWFNVVGADYTGSACPDEASLRDLVVHIKL